MERRKRKHKRHQRGKGAGLYHERHMNHREGNKKSFRGILQRSDIFQRLKRLEEDILKYIYEHDDKKVEDEKLKKTFQNINGDIDQIVNKLISEEFIIKNDNYYSLTRAGEEIAELIFRIHNEIEEYIKGKALSWNAHQMAHILEHKLTEEQIEKMIKISKFKERGVSLTDFKLLSGTIVDVTLNNCSIWTKLVSVGIFPGQKIYILNRTTSNYLIEVKNSKFAIDRNLADGIFLIP